MPTNALCIYILYTRWPVVNGTRLEPTRFGKWMSTFHVNPYIKHRGKFIGHIIYQMTLSLWLKHFVDSIHDVVIKWENFHITSPLWGESTGHQWIPSHRPVTRSFDAFFDLRLNNQLSKQSRSGWFETPSRSIWRHCIERNQRLDIKWCLSFDA